jgi:hypothetical protein
MRAVEVARSGERGKKEVACRGIAKSGGYFVEQLVGGSER